MLQYKAGSWLAAATYYTCKLIGLDKISRTAATASWGQLGARTRCQWGNCTNVSAEQRRRSMLTTLASCWTSRLDVVYVPPHHGRLLSAVRCCYRLYRRPSPPGHRGSCLEQSAAASRLHHHCLSSAAAWRQICLGAASLDCTYPPWLLLCLKSDTVVVAHINRLC